MIQLFIVFHKNIFDDCYKKIPQEVLNTYFTFYAVNEKIPKNYTKNKYKIINEWELKIYDASFQERGYNENSAIYHIYANKLHKKYKYIGFFQYDMTFNDNIIEFLKIHIQDKPVYFPFKAFNYYFCDDNFWCAPLVTNFIINDYENYFNRKFSTKEIYPLYNSYVLPIETYEKIMKWVTQLYDKMYPWCIQYPCRTHQSCVGGIYERVMAYAIGNEKIPFRELNINHDQSYKHISY
jgi:hypothetical protein